MTPNEVWINRGPDGRHYYVRKKSSQSSLRKLLTEALPRSARSFFSRDSDSRQNNHIRCVNPGRPLIMPPPSSSTPLTAHEPAPSPTDPSFQAQQPPQQPVNMYLVPPAQDTSNPDSNDHFAHNYIKPHPHFPPYPQPPIFPMSVPYPVLGQGLPALLPQPFMGHQAPPFAPAPPPPFVVTRPLSQVHQHQHQQPQQPIPSMSHSSGMHYKCDSCGRFRSARYHQRHPIPLGSLPAKTTCQRCREEATDTEDDSSSDGYAPRIHRHRSLRARLQKSLSFRNARSRSRSRPGRAQSSTGRRLIENHHDGYAGPPYSPQISPVDLQDNRQGVRFLRQDSPDTELPARFRAVKLVPQERVVYLESEEEHSMHPGYYNDTVRSNHHRVPSRK